LKNKNEDSVRFEQTIKVTYEQTLVQIKREKEDLSRMYNEVENRYILSSQEIERLTQNLKAKQDDLIKLDQQNRSQANDLETWKRKYADLEADYSHTYEVEVTKKYALYEQNMADLKKQNEDYRVKITGTMQEIERLNNILRLKVDESVQLNTKINSLSSDIEDYRRKLRETENVSTQNFTTLKN
jgi:chromosome segregation ATPase